MYTSTMVGSFGSKGRGEFLEHIGEYVHLHAREDAKKIIERAAAAANVGGIVDVIIGGPKYNAVMQMMGLELKPEDIEDYIEKNIKPILTVKANPHLNRVGTDFVGYGDEYYLEIKAYLDPFLANQPPEAGVGAFSYWNQILGAVALTFGTGLIMFIISEYLKNVRKYTRSFQSPRAFHVT